MKLKLLNKFIVTIYLFMVTSLLGDFKPENTFIVSEGDSLEISSLLDSCWKYRTDAPSRALEFSKNALKLIDSKEFISLKPKTLNYIGVVYRKLGDLEKSFHYFNDALELARILKDSLQIGYTYNNLTDYYIKKASYSIALENVLKGYQIFENQNHKIGMAYSLNYLGEIYIKHGDFEKALQYLEEALKLRDEINDLRGYSNTAINIGEIYFKLNNFDKAIEYYNESIKINKFIKYRKGTSRVLSLKGDIFFAKNEFIKAKNNIYAALYADKKIENKAGQIVNLNKLGLICLKINDYKLAKKSLDEALLLASESGHLDQEMLSYLYLSQYYSLVDNNKKALELLNKYITIKDSIYSNENMGRFADLQTLFVTNRKEIENKLLQKEIELSTRTTLYLLVISIVTLIIILLLVSKYRTQNKNNNLLKELNSSKDKFFSILAHDLKNPFQGLLGYTEMLNDDYDSLDQEEIRNAISSLHSVTRNVYRLLEGLLDWSRAQTGRMEYKPILIKLAFEVKAVIELSKDVAKAKNISLLSEVDDTVTVFADRDMLSTILRNLVTNAIKFTKEGNSVKILARKNKNETVITIWDNGIGMSQEEMDSLFRIDVHHTTLGTNGEEGTGVGLILCNELVQNNGGKIWAESELGKGSKFIFTLPNFKK